MVFNRRVDGTDPTFSRGDEEFASLPEAEEAIRTHVHRHNFLMTTWASTRWYRLTRYFGMVEEAKQALVENLRGLGPGLGWLKELVSHDGPSLRPPTVLELVVGQGKLELVVLGQRFKPG